MMLATFYTVIDISDSGKKMKRVRGVNYLFFHSTSNIDHFGIKVFISTQKQI